jgi:hypothetical protein
MTSLGAPRRSGAGPWGPRERRRWGVRRGEVPGLVRPRYAILRRRFASPSCDGAKKGRATTPLEKGALKIGRGREVHAWHTLTGEVSKTSLRENETAGSDAGRFRVRVDDGAVPTRGRGGHFFPVRECRSVDLVPGISVPSANSEFTAIPDPGRRQDPPIHIAAR